MNAKNERSVVRVQHPESNDIAKCDIFALHDFICELNNDPEGNTIVVIELEPHEMLPEEHRKELEVRVNRLLDMIRETDAYLHDVAEFSC